MQYVVLKDNNGHTATFDVTNFADQLAPYMHALYGVDVSAIQALRAVMQGPQVLTSEHIKELVEKLQAAEATTESANIPVLEPAHLQQAKIAAEKALEDLDLS